MLCLYCFLGYMYHCAYAVMRYMIVALRLYDWTAVTYITRLFELVFGTMIDLGCYTNTPLVVDDFAASTHLSSSSVIQI